METLIPSAVELKAIVKEKAYPMTFSWSRLEGRPRANDFNRALKAEVRDALWMLTKQWQMGEFEGDDAGSPVVAKLCTSVAEVDKYKADGKDVQAFDKEVPFEAKVEQRPLPFTTFNQEISLDLRLIMGRKWMQLLDRDGWMATAKKFFLDNYGIKKPDPAKKEDAAICAHPETWQAYAAVAGRMMDGAKFFFDLGTTPKFYDRADFPEAGNAIAFKKLAEEFTGWYNDLFYQPSDPENDAWIPSQLEYQFAISASTEAGEKVMHAEAYYHGHLDWYNVDIDQQTPSLGTIAGNTPPIATPVRKTQSIIPAPVMFAGMPNTRWWAFEDGKTNFSNIKPDTTDLAKLLLIEFGLVYANDWYLIPYQVPVGTVTKIKGLSLTNSFGEHFWIEAAGRGDDKDWTRWNMFSTKIDSVAPVAADTDLLLLPTVAKIQEGKPFEEVVFVRDEMANMVWGVETVVPLPGGTSKSGFEAAAEYNALMQQLLKKQFGEAVVGPPVKDGDEEAKIRYEIMNTIPENWIPFIPVHQENSNREVQLQRAAMPRFVDNVSIPKPDKIRPRTALLQVGLATQDAYFVHEEEVPRSGVRVEHSFQRTRWSDGKVYVWFGVRKTNGRGEGSSGLGFDRIVAKRQQE